MKISFKSIKLKNFLSYGNQVTEFNFKSGLSCVNGSNGAGKSSFLLDVLCFNLFGSAYRSINLSDLINNKNGSKLWTESTFEVDDSVFRIERGLKPSILKIYKDDVEQNLLSHKDLIQEKINKLLGINHSLFKQIISLSILNNKPFLILPKAEKTSILESIFNIKVFGKMLKTLKKNYTELKSSLDISNKELELYKQGLQKDVETIKELQKSKEEFDSKKEKSIKELSDKINNSRLKLDSVLALIKEIDLEKLKVDKEIKVNLKVDIEDHSSNIRILTNEINQLFEERLFFNDPENTIEDFEDRYSKEIEPKIKDILGQLKELEAENLTFKTKLQEDCRIKNDKLNRETVEAENQIKVLNKEKTFLTKDYLEKNLEEVISLNKKLNEVKNNVEILKEEIEKLEMGEGVCDYCKRTIDKEHQAKEIKSRYDKIHSLLSEKDKFKSEMSGLIENHIKEKNQLIDLEIEEQRIKIEEQRIKKKVNEDKLNTEIELKLNLIDSRRNELEKKKSEIVSEEIEKIKDNLNLRIEMKKVEKEALETCLNNLRKQLGDFEIQEKLYSDKKSELEKLKIQKEHLDDLIIDSEDSLKKYEKDEFNFDIEKMKTDFEGKKIIYQELKTKNFALKKKVKVSDVIKDMLSEEGIKKFFFSRLIPELNKSINTYLDHFELPIKFEFDSEFEYTINDFGSNRPYESFSGGERGRIDISIVLSFLKLNKLINGCDINLLILDELLDSGLDKNAVEIILEKLKELSDQENLCTYVISHKGVENSMWFDHNIKIYKENGFSKIEV